MNYFRGPLRSAKPKISSNVNMKITSFVEYNKRAAETQMESCKNEDYLRLGLISEVGELAAIFKRAIRGDFKLEDKRKDILLELGDICWYLDRLAEVRLNDSFIFYADINSDFAKDCKEWDKSLCTIKNFMRDVSCVLDSEPHLIDFVSIFSQVGSIADRFGFSIWDVLTANVNKLAKRKKLGMITGSGDHRGEEAE